MILSREGFVMERLILASGSPRRRELLESVGIPYEVLVSEADESCSLPPEKAVIELSRRKAEAVAVSRPGRFVLAADTLVAVDGRPLGKPASPEDAEKMLRMLSGRSHWVHTGVTVVSPSGRFLSGADHSEVFFCEIPEKELAAYARSGEPMDKAGAYAIQGKASLWIERIIGSPSSVIGLPMHLVRDLLLEAGWVF